LSLLFPDSTQKVNEMRRLVPTSFGYDLSLPQDRHLFDIALRDSDCEFFSVDGHDEISDRSNIRNTKYF